MRPRFDRFAKESWTIVFERAARVRTHAEVSPNPQYVDLEHEPDPSRLAAVAPFGLIARLLEHGPELVEFFHDAPVVGDVLLCVQKQIEMRRRRTDPSDPTPHLMDHLAQRPTIALERLRFAPDPRLPLGFYTLAPGFGVSLDAVNELPVERATLLFRVLGAGAVLRGALREIATLPIEAPESELRPMVLGWWAVLDATAVRSPEEEEIYMTTRDLFDASHPLTT